MDERRNQRNRRNRGPRMTKAEFKMTAKENVLAAELAAMNRGVSLAQIQLWELAAK